MQSSTYKPAGVLNAGQVERCFTDRWLGYKRQLSHHSCSVGLAGCAGTNVLVLAAHQPYESAPLLPRNMDAGAGNLCRDTW